MSIRLAHPQLVEPVVIDAKVVTEFVEDSLSHLFADEVRVIAAHLLYWLLVDADLVRDHEVVAFAAACKRNTVI